MNSVDRIAAPVLRSFPLAAFRPLRAVIHRLGRRHPVRMAATLVLLKAIRAYRHRLAGRLSEIRPLDQPELSFEPVDSMVMDAVYWLGVRGYEGIVAQVWTELCARSHSVLEVGGNVGLFTVIGGRAAAGAYTVVEPVPAVAATLRANLARNGLNRVELLQAAVVPGSERRDVTLNLPDEAWGMPVGAHLIENSELSERGSLRQIVVPGLPIGQLAAGRDLIKIDAEGIEASLLADIRGLLIASRPTLIVEVLPEADRLGVLLAELAAEAGYLIHVIPEYGSETIVTVPAAEFTAAVPGRYRSKDVVLSVRPISAAGLSSG